MKVDIFKDSLINGFICRCSFPQPENISYNITYITSSKIFHLTIFMNKLTCLPKGTREYMPLKLFLHILQSLLLKNKISLFHLTTTVVHDSVLLNFHHVPDMNTLFTLFFIEFSQPSLVGGISFL